MNRWLKMGCGLLFTAMPWLSWAADSPVFQMLLSPEQQQQQGYARQRLMYPKGSAQRIAAGACVDGFRLLLQENKPAAALTEFNRAWRFDPESYSAWWGAGIVSGRLATEAGDAGKDDECDRLLTDSITLLEKAVALAPAKEKVRARCDLLLSYSLLGGHLLATGKAGEAEVFLQKGKLLAADLVAKNPDNGQVRLQAATHAFYCGDYALAQQEIAAAKQYRYPVPADFEADVQKHLAGQ